MFMSNVFFVFFVGLLCLLSACTSNLSNKETKHHTQIDQGTFSGFEKLKHDVFVNKKLNVTEAVLENRPSYIKVKGIGYGETVEEARRDALNDLVSRIHIDVFKEVKVCKTNQGDCGGIVRVKTRSELPILGGNFERLGNTQDNISFVAWIDSKNSLPLYVRDLKQMNERIKYSIKTLDTLKDQDERYHAIEEILDLVFRYDKKRLVANVLGGGALEQRSRVNVRQLKNELKKIGRKVNSLGFAAEILVRNISATHIFVQTPQVKNTREVTPFANAMKGYVSSQLDTVSEKSVAKFTLEGEYEILESGDIFLNYKLVDLNYRVLNRKSVIIEKLAHSDFRSQPSVAEFESTFNADVPVTHKFHAQLQTQGGTKSLYYKSGDRIKLLVRLNRPGYYYMIGHISQKGKELSYLLDLNEGVGNAKFIRYISKDQVNRFVEIAEFDVIPPFGVEHLQLIAASQPFEVLPQSTYRDGYYVIDGSEKNIVHTVNKIRGMLENYGDSGTLTAESTLTYTTAK